MSLYIISGLDNTPSQFPVTLSGVDYVFITKWNYIFNNWNLDILDADENPLACNIAMVAGVDLLEGLEYLGIPGQLYVFTDNDPFADPTYDSLGDTCNLYYQTSVT